MLAWLQRTFPSVTTGIVAILIITLILLADIKKIKNIAKVVIAFIYGVAEVIIAFFQAFYLVISRTRIDRFPSQNLSASDIAEIKDHISSNFDVLSDSIKHQVIGIKNHVSDCFDLEDFENQIRQDCHRDLKDFENQIREDCRKQFEEELARRRQILHASETSSPVLSPDQSPVANTFNQQSVAAISYSPAFASPASDPGLAIVHVAPTSNSNDKAAPQIDKEEDLAVAPTALVPINNGSQSSNPNIVREQDLRTPTPGDRARSLSVRSSPPTFKTPDEEDEFGLTPLLGQALPVAQQPLAATSTQPTDRHPPFLTGPNRIECVTEDSLEQVAKAAASKKKAVKKLKSPQVFLARRSTRDRKKTDRYGFIN